jgi:colanic acid biosynthesis glycosyl transferase WcaI
MRVLLVSQYYDPEPGATQNRMAAFATGLVERGHQVTVVCEQPNHPTGRFHPGYGKRPLSTERTADLEIRRLWVAASPHKTPFRRALFYGTFAAGAALAVATMRTHDVLFATSPPLPGALGACALAHARKMPYVLDVRDLWPAAAEALGELRQGRVMAAFQRAEKWLYDHAAVVTATTRPFCSHIAGVSPDAAPVLIPNGALDALLQGPAARRPERDTFRVGYVGNLGIAQGLRIVLDAAEELRGEDVRFLLVGGGPLADDLRAEARARDLDRIVAFRDCVPVQKVGEMLASCSALLVPLGSHRALEDFVPSKIYDAMAVGRPILLAARGESRALVQRYDCGLAVDPEDGEGLAAAVRRLDADRCFAEALGARGRAAAKGLTRSAQVARLEEVLTSAATGKEPPGSTSEGGDSQPLAVTVEH